jgi:hypothetical protein
MASAITQLQQDALDGKVRVSDLLRKALVVARKLELHEFQEWIEKELRGYGDSSDAPPYREVTGQVMARNPYRGWVHVGFDRQSDREFFSHRKCGQSIAELESLVEGSREGGFHMPFPRDVSLNFSGINLQTNVSLFTSRSALVGIIDTVRTIVLNWSLKLEEEGVLGEALSFSASEREAAHRNPQHITNFYGPVQSAQVQQGVGHAVQVSVVGSPDPAGVRSFIAALRAEVSALGLGENAQAEVEAQARTIEAQLDSPTPKPSILREGLHSIRAVLEGAAGGVAAQLLLQLGKLLTG